MSQYFFPLDNEESVRHMARKMRGMALCMVHSANASHIGSCFSVADILAVLYGCTLRIRPDDPGWAERDRLVLSKGHSAAILYSALAARGFFPEESLKSYCRQGSLFLGHVSQSVPGVEVSTGSLGHGLSIACGMALTGKRTGRSFRVFNVLSDGELDAGSTWEAILFASNHRLDNLMAVVDYNKLQGFGRVEEVLSLEPLVDKFKAFGWAVNEVDGHDVACIRQVLSGMPFETGKPSIIIAHTIKGKGIGYMEDQLAWHYKSPNDDQLAQGLQELGCFE